MMSLTIEHPLFDLLRNEHRQIESYLVLMLNNIENKSYVEWLWNNAEILHHYKEETILFNFLSDKLCVMSGGPLCMFFLDGYISDPPLDKCKTVSGQIPELEDHQKKIFDMGSTMRVPINEHRAGKEILKYTLNNWDTLTLDVRIKNLKLYNEIQREHLNKEENCFFYLCANLLSPEEADLLCKKWLI